MLLFDVDRIGGTGQADRTPFMWECRTRNRRRARPQRVDSAAAGSRAMPRPSPMMPQPWCDWIHRTPSGRPALRRIAVLQCWCWQASRPCAGQACGCASRRPGTSRWCCCGRRWWASPRPASRRRWRPMRRLAGSRRTGTARPGDEERAARGRASGARFKREGRRSHAVRALARSWRAMPIPWRSPTSSRATLAASCCGATVRRRGQQGGAAPE